MNIIKNPTKWWHHLLIIPIATIASFLLLLITLFIDYKLSEYGLLSIELPMVSLYVFYICLIIIIVLTIRAIILSTNTIIKNMDK